MLPCRLLNLTFWITASEDSVVKGYLLDFAPWIFVFDWISFWLAAILIPSYLSIWTLSVSCPPSNVSHLNLDYLTVLLNHRTAPGGNIKTNPAFYGLKPRIPQPLAT
ncbi:hypothetical protein AMECASPLE_020529 [Ameca splendens]|uniref:Uncharacterized protein n=1 Tax=Ameca splendens TaxID=208324 RepID=A0ABV0Z2I0_9TELE